jgi:hypothetical protein
VFCDEYKAKIQSKQYALSLLQRGCCTYHSSYNAWHLAVDVWTIETAALTASLLRILYPLDLSKEGNSEVISLESSP